MARNEMKKYSDGMVLSRPDFPPFSPKKQVDCGQVDSRRLIPRRRDLRQGHLAEGGSFGLLRSRIGSRISLRLNRLGAR